MIAKLYKQRELSTQFSCSLFFQLLFPPFALRAHLHREAYCRQGWERGFLRFSVHNGGSDE